MERGGGYASVYSPVFFISIIIIGIISISNVKVCVREDGIKDDFLNPPTSLSNDLGTIFFSQNDVFSRS